MITELAIFALRALFALLLYLFLLGVWRAAWRETQSLAQAPPSGDSLRAFLIVVSAPEPEPLLGTRVPLRPVTTLGRGAHNTVVLSDRSVSGAHARLELRDARWWLEDLGSTNGTWANGHRLAQAQPLALQSGETFQCGQTVLRLESG